MEGTQHVQFFKFHFPTINFIYFLLKKWLHMNTRGWMQDPRRGHWWLQLGSGPLVGYWPSFLFSHLGGHANMVQFGGEVVNSRPSGSHTPTQMGSGHFPREGSNRAAYFRNMQIVDWDNSLVPAASLRLVADHPGCYDIKGGYNRAWGNYFYYGGPGRNVHCP
jgi:hypothetical protein